MDRSYPWVELPQAPWLVWCQLFAKNLLECPIICGGFPGFCQFQDSQSRTFRHLERDLSLMKTSNAERYCGSAVSDATTAQRFSQYGVDIQNFCALSFLEVELLNETEGDEVTSRSGVCEGLH